MVQLKRLRLCELETHLFLWRNDPSIMRWCRQPFELHYGDHLEWFKEQRVNPTIEMWGIHTGLHGLVGVCGLTDVNMIHKRAEFSLYVDPAMVGQGIGPYALVALLSKGFDTLCLRTIWGESFKGNPAINMFAEIGFKVEGERIDFYFKDGKYINAVLLSIQSDTFNNLKKKGHYD